MSVVALGCDFESHSYHLRVSSIQVDDRVADTERFDGQIERTKRNPITRFFLSTIEGSILFHLRADLECLEVGSVLTTDDNALLNLRDGGLLRGPLEVHVTERSEDGYLTLELFGDVSSATRSREITGYIEVRAKASG